MAFNPFHTFRRHQKAIFSVLTIICMFVFILQFGAGDPFTRAMAWFGYNRNRGDLVTSLYGKKVYSAELAKLAQQRQLVNEFYYRMTMLQIPDQQSPFDKFSDASGGHVLRMKKLGDIFALPRGMEGLGPNERIPSMMGALTLQRYRSRIPSIFTPFPRGKEREQRFAETLQDLQTAQSTAMTGPIGFHRLGEEEAVGLGQLAVMLRFQAWELDPKRPPKELLFGGTIDSNEELLDFLVWKHQADRLGINLVEEDVRKLVNRDAAFDMVVKKFEQDERVKLFLRSQKAMPNASAADLAQGLTDEYRVVLAQRALLGQGPGVFAYAPTPAEQAPWAPTPSEFYRFYRDHRTMLDVTLLPVPAARFLDRVAGSPSEEELQRLFAKYRTTLPAPELDTPGFKEPRRARVEYLSVTADPPSGFAALGREVNPDAWYFTDQGRGLSVQPYLQLMLAPATSLGGGLAPGAVLTAAMLHETDTRRFVYPSAAARMNATTWGAGGYGMDFLKSQYMFRLGTVSFATGAGPEGLFSALGNWYGTAWIYQEAYEPHKDRMAYAAVGALAQMALPVPGVVVPGALGGQGPRTEPSAWMLERAFKDEAERLRGVAMREEARVFATELLRLKGKDEAAAFVRDVNEGKEVTVEVAARLGDKPDEKKTEKRRLLGLKGRVRATGEEAKDRYALVKDEELKPLREAVERARVGKPEAPDLAALLFARTGTYDAVLWTESASRDWAESPEPYVIWRVKDAQEVEPKTLNVARPAVEQAWRMLKARELARERARKIEAEVRAAAATESPARLAVLLEEKGGADDLKSSTFQLNGVARLTTDPSPAFRARAYEPYKVPADKAELFPFPRANLVDQLQGALKKPGDVTLVTDRPGTTVYVAVLTRRQEPPDRNEGIPPPDTTEQPTFLGLYGKGREDTLWVRHLLEEKRRDYRRRFLEQLRAEAAPEGVENGKFKLPENVRGGPVAVQQQQQDD